MAAAVVNGRQAKEAQRDVRAVVCKTAAAQAAVAGVDAQIHAVVAGDAVDAGDARPSAAREGIGGAAAHAVEAGVAQRTLEVGIRPIVEVDALKSPSDAAASEVAKLDVSAARRFYKLPCNEVAAGDVIA